MDPLPPAPGPISSASQISVGRITQAMQARFNPISGLTPELLAIQLEEYRIGGLRVAKLWDAIEERWPILKSVASKRKKAVSRLPWDVLIREEIPEEMAEQAVAQRDVLKRFYSRIRATSVLNQNERGGVALLLRQMMHAVGQRHSVHEIVWQPRKDGSLAAEFRHCPLWFFENRSGALRYLPQEGAITGNPMPATQWLVTCGDGLMEASSVAYIYRDLPLKDWLAFSEKYGIPFLHGKTTAQPGSAEWTAAEEALSEFGSDGALLTSPDVSVDALTVSVSGEATYKALIDLHDRYASILWRGGDLSTQSAGQSVGASLQSEETDTLLADDAMTLSETLNENVDLTVLRWFFGPDVEPLAYFQLQVPQRKNIDQDIKVDQFLLGRGVRLSVDDVMERYGRTPADEDDEVLGTGPAPVVPAMPGQLASEIAGTGDVLDALENESDPRLVQESLSEVAAALAGELAPLRARLEMIAAEPNFTRQMELIAELRAELPQMLKTAPGGRVQLAFSKLFGSGVVSGLTAAAA